MLNILSAMCQNGPVKRRRDAKNTPEISARLGPRADRARHCACGYNAGRFSYSRLGNSADALTSLRSPPNSIPRRFLLLKLSPVADVLCDALV